MQNSPKDVNDTFSKNVQLISISFSHNRLNLTMSTIPLSKAEKSYITAGFKHTTPQRADGRGLTDYRCIALETGVAPLANGSARLCLGRNLNDNGGGTEILAATKLEVENISVDGSGEGQEGGRFVVHVSW